MSESFVKHVCVRVLGGYLRVGLLGHGIDLHGASLESPTDRVWRSISSTQLSTFHVHLLNFSHFDGVWSLLIGVLSS